jgi:hypothetical protein
MSTPEPRQELKDCICDYRIWFHMLDEGEPVDDGFTSIYTMATTIKHVLRKNTVEYKRINALIPRLEACHKRNAWHKADLKSVDASLGIIADKYPALLPSAAHKVLKRVFA